MPPSRPKVYFPNLNGLRFFCFLAVFFFHSFATPYADVTGSDTYQFIKYQLFGNGNLGVNFFFVLSGFLITYLLLEEKTAFKKIHIGHFYMRRVLKIWPLFYFCVFFGFVVFPWFKSLFGETPQETANFPYYLALINNFDMIQSDADASVLRVLWSVAIEEQFYLVWPLLLAVLRPRFLPALFLLIIVGSYGFRVQHAYDKLVYEFHTLTCIGDLALGGLGAYLAFYSASFMRQVKGLPRWFIYAVYAAAAVLFLFKQDIFSGSPYWIAMDRLIISTVFLLVILEQNYSSRSFYKMENFTIVSRLGNYTYGLYCLHMIGILVAFTLLKYMGWNRSLWQIILLEGGLSLALTLVLAYLSFHLYEKHFLTFKKRFQFIRSSGNQRPAPVVIMEETSEGTEQLHGLPMAATGERPVENR